MKNKNGLVLPLIDELADIIERRRAARLESIPWVFHRTLKGHIRLVRRFDKAWKTACKQAGLPVARPVKKHFHELRQTTARNLNRAGVPDPIVMQIMGHKTRAMYDRYNIVNEEDMRDALAKMQKRLPDRHNSGTNGKQDWDCIS